MKKIVKYIIGTGLVLLVGYNSLYFRKLSEVRKSDAKQFDAVAFAKNLWEKEFPVKLDQATMLPVLIQAVNENKEAGFQKYSNALAIGNYRYALIKSLALVTEVREDEISVQLPAGGGDTVLTAVLATEFVYGNAIRDASGLVEVRDFPNTTELNSISEELNRIIRSTVIPPIRSGIKKGGRLLLTAAVELNREHVKWNGLELMPLRVQLEK
jgi:predicted lipoprotein